jgi:hypothetical protein
LACQKAWFPIPLGGATIPRPLMTTRRLVICEPPGSHPFYGDSDYYQPGDEKVTVPRIVELFGQATFPPPRGSDHLSQIADAPLTPQETGQVRMGQNFAN